MVKKSLPSGFYSKWTTILVATIFFPLFSYTVSQWLNRDRAEQIIESIYDRQLRSVLFTMNQYSWEVCHDWMEQVSAVAAAQDSAQQRAVALQTILKRYPPVTALLLGSSMNPAWLIAREGVSISERETAALRIAWRTFFLRSTEEVEQVLHHAEEGYLHSLSIPWSPADGSAMSLLLFPIWRGHGVDPLFAAMIIDQRSCIDVAVAQKFRELNDRDLIFAVAAMPGDRLLYTSQPGPNTDFEIAEKMWIVPDLEMRIKIRGVTLGQLVHKRIRTNLLFLAAINLLALLGALFLFRSVQSYMRAAKMKTDFVANVSHEVRTPLALIQMHAELLKMGRAGTAKKQRQYFDTIYRESVRLGRLIDNILDFSRMESGIKEPDLQPVNLAEVIRNTLATYRIQLQEDGFRLWEDWDHPTPVIDAHPGLLQQALTNLLDNAVKFSPKVKEIGLRLYHSDGEVALEVSDKGIGIAAEEQNRIFEKFYRCEDRLVQRTRGTGLGLPLVKHIMEIHNGRIQVSSEPGQGATLRLLFPIRKQG